MKWARLAQTKWWHIDAAGAAAGCILTVLAYFCGLKPILAQRRTMTDSAVQLNFQRSRSIQLTLESTRLRTALAQLRQRLSQNVLSLEDARRINHRIAQLNELATENGLTIDDIKPGDIAPSCGYDIMHIKLTGTGTYQSCTKFMHSLRSNFPDTGLISWQITDSKAQSGVLAKFELDLLWHTLPGAR